MRGRLMLGLAAAAVCAEGALAQTTGGIAGWISEASGAPLPGVTVEAVGSNLQGRRMVTTARDGTYRLPALPVGRYIVRASLPGFASIEKTVAVSIGSMSIARITLQLAVRESAFVSDEAPF